MRVIPALQYELILNSDLMEGHRDVLCVLHHELARRHAELKLAKDVATCAELASLRHLGMVEFMAYELDERLKADTDAMREKKVAPASLAANSADAQLPSPPRLHAVNGSG